MPNRDLIALFRLFRSEDQELIALSLVQDIERGNQRFYTPLPSVRRVLGTYSDKGEKFKEDPELDYMDEMDVKDLVLRALKEYPEEFIDESYEYSFEWGKVPMDEADEDIANLDLDSIVGEEIKSYLASSPIQVPYMVYRGQ